MSTIPYPVISIVDWSGNVIFAPVTPFGGISAAAAATAIKNGPGTLFALTFTNYQYTAGNALYCALYNALASNVVLGTTSPVAVLVLTASANTATGASVSLNIPIQGVAFSTGISFSITDTFNGTNVIQVFAQGGFV